MSILKASSYALFWYVKYFNWRAQDLPGVNLIFINGRANTRRTFLFLSFNNKIFTSFCFALKISTEFKYSETDSWLSMKSKYLFIYFFIHLFIYLFVHFSIYSFTHSFMHLIIHWLNDGKCINYYTLFYVCSFLLSLMIFSFTFDSQHSYLFPLFFKRIITLQMISCAASLLEYKSFR